MNKLEPFMTAQQPTAARPLMGVTILLVEDSRFSCEAVRLLCLRSGARIRRADTIASARRHLQTYRPAVVIIDLGLPDGSGLPLIADLARGLPRIDVILATSGDPDLSDDAIAAGADGFLEKPIEGLAAFQSAILAHLPADRQPPAPRAISDEVVTPDPVALRDDLSHVAEVLKSGTDEARVEYVTQFLTGVALSSRDADLERAVDRILSARRAGRSCVAGLSALSEVVERRLAGGGVI